MSRFVAPVLAEVAKLKAKIDNDMNAMEQMRVNQVKLEEKLKAQVEVSKMLAANNRLLKEASASHNDVMEQMRLHQVKLEEKLKTEVEKNESLTEKNCLLEETLTSKEEIIKVLTSGAARNGLY